MKIVNKNGYLDFEDDKITPEQLKTLGFTFKHKHEEFELWLYKDNQFIIVEQISWEDDKDWIVCEYLIYVVGRTLSDHLHYNIPFDQCYGDFTEEPVDSNDLININELLKYLCIINKWD